MIVLAFEATDPDAKAPVDPVAFEEIDPLEAKDLRELKLFLKNPEVEEEIVLGLMGMTGFAVFGGRGTFEGLGGNRPICTTSAFHTAMKGFRAYVALGQPP